MLLFTPSIADCLVSHRLFTFGFLPCRHGDRDVCGVQWVNAYQWSLFLNSDWWRDLKHVIMKFIRHYRITEFWLVEILKKPHNYRWISIICSVSRITKSVIVYYYKIEIYYPMHFPQTCRTRIYTTHWLTSQASRVNNRVKVPNELPIYGVLCQKGDSNCNTTVHLDSWHPVTHLGTLPILLSPPPNWLQPKSPCIYAADSWV